MAQKVTSLADFFRRAEAGVEYQDAACRAYESFFGEIPEWNVVREKIDKWANDNVGDGRNNRDCGEMVQYLNLFIEDPTYRRR